LKCSNDPIKGVDRRGDRYWKDVAAEYNLHARYWKDVAAEYNLHAPN